MYWIMRENKLFNGIKIISLENQLYSFSFYASFSYNQPTKQQRMIMRNSLPAKLPSNQFGERTKLVDRHRATLLYILHSIIFPFLFIRVYFSSLFGLNKTLGNENEEEIKIYKLIELNHSCVRLSHFPLYILNRSDIRGSAEMRETSNRASFS